MSLVAFNLLAGNAVSIEADDVESTAAMAVGQLPGPEYDPATRIFMLSGDSLVVLGSKATVDAAIAAGRTPNVLALSVTAPIVDTGTATHPNIGISAASGAARGTMSAADFTKLAGIPSDAQSAAQVAAAIAAFGVSNAWTPTNQVIGSPTNLTSAAMSRTYYIRIGSYVLVVGRVFCTWSGINLSSLLTFDFPPGLPMVGTTRVGAVTQADPGNIIALPGQSVTSTGGPALVLNTLTNTTSLTTNAYFWCVYQTP